MNPAKDNPVIRFTTFWWAISILLGFGILLGVIVFWNRAVPETTEDFVAKGRYERKAALERAQEEELSPKKIEAAIPAMAEKLVMAKPVAVEKPEQVVPGSPTAGKLAAEPTAVLSATTTPLNASAPIDPAVMEMGKTQFIICSACHGPDAQGGPLAPPLSGSEWVAGPVSNLIRIQFRGLNGPIVVKGKERNFPVGMAALTYQTDEQIAAVLTYVRNSFGNKASAVTPEEVKSLRGEVGKPPLTVNDLQKP